MRKFAALGGVNFEFSQASIQVGLLVCALLVHIVNRLLDHVLVSENAHGFAVRDSLAQELVFREFGLARKRFDTRSARIRISILKGGSLGGRVSQPFEAV